MTDQRKELMSVVRHLPLSSGVYLMKSESGEVIYIGKAVSLRKRVQSYFRGRVGDVMTKTDRLVQDIFSIDYIETDSEAEALILEASLVKKHLPKYNINLRDDKSFPLIQITGEEFPRVSVERPRKKNPKHHYYGPYVKPVLIREALQILRKIFKFRTCQPLPDKECLDYHIGLCDAPCIGKISEDEYVKRIRSVQLILEGRKDQLYRELKTHMEDLAARKEYERASEVRDQLQAIGALYSGTKDVNYYKEAEQLQRVLNLPKMPERIETFDISNTMGQQAVGSMVSFFHGKPDKKNYRRYKIKQVEGIDDFRMIAEVVRRRYRRLKSEGKSFPDLIVIDGGKGQLSAACHELKKLDVEIPIVSLAKKEELIFIPSKRNPVRLSHHTLGLNLLQRTRDEAHRFALHYHRKLRSKKFLSS